MKPLKRMRYHTMHSWNQSTAPAYDLKIHHVVDNDLQAKVLDLMESPDFYGPINDLIADFDGDHNYEWQAGFNGRSGGYLVLYRGGTRSSGYLSYCTACGQKNCTAVPEGEPTGRCGRCGADTRVNFTRPDITVFTYPGKHIDDEEVPGAVLRSFRQLAVDIVKTVEDMARRCTVVEEPYTVMRIRKTIRCPKE